MPKEEPEKVEMFGRDFECLICKHKKFWRQEAQLNAAVTTFFKLDWIDESALCLICAECGYIHWFVTQ